MRGERMTAGYWNVDVYGFDTVVVPALTAGAAKYAVWRAASEAGYYAGRDGFGEMLASGCRAWRATPADVDRAAANGHIIAGRRALEEADHGG